MWSSVKLSDLVYFAGRKISNGCLESGRLYLAFWMVRTGLLTNPAHGINSFWSIPWWQRYCSCPLTWIISELLSIWTCPSHRSPQKIGCQIKSIEALSNAWKVHTNESGRPRQIFEIISMDITLRAISEAEPVSCDWNYENIDKLPNVCATKQFIFESRNDEQETEAGESDSHLRIRKPWYCSSENRLDSEGGSESKKA